LTENVQLEDEPSFYLGKEAITNIIGNDTSIKFNDLPNSQDENIKNELKIINAILNNNNMKIYFCDATDPELGVPCVITYISGAKIAARENFDLNLLSGVIYESHRLGNIRRGVEYIDYAKKDGPQWLYYSGLSKLRENDFNGALSYFAKISEKNSPIKYIKFGLYCYALCCLAMGREKEAIKVFKKLLYVYNFLYGNYEHAELKNEISEIANNYELFLKTHEYYIQNIW
jgi:tetratricopeptide (TPR) repeat protein